MKKAIFGLLALMLVLGAGCSTGPEENLNKDDGQKNVPEQAEQVRLNDEISIHAEDVEINLVGSWSVSGADYEKITIEENSMFTNYMNGSILEMGAWVYDGGMLVLKGPLTEKLYDQIVRDGDTVTLDGDGISEVWQLINEG